MNLFYLNLSYCKTIVTTPLSPLARSLLAFARLNLPLTRYACLQAEAVYGLPEDSYSPEPRRLGRVTTNADFVISYYSKVVVLLTTQI